VKLGLNGIKADVEQPRQRSSIVRGRITSGAPPAGRA